MLNKPHRCETAHDYLVLLGRDAWLANDDEVSLTYRPLAPPSERHLDRLTERAATSSEAVGWGLSSASNRALAPL